MASSMRDTISALMVQGKMALERTFGRYMMIDLASCIVQLEGQAQTITALVAGMSSQQARWKPAPDSWSVLEVLNHLYDEEREDFRVRLKYILGGVDGLPPPIDPGGWVAVRRYNERDLEESLSRFGEERSRSLAWLRGLVDPNWDKAIEATFGRLRAGDLLMAWLAHDLLHQRQLVELRYAYHQRQAQPYQVEYAGDW
jgi:hypothetical protein